MTELLAFNQSVSRDSDDEAEGKIPAAKKPLASIVNEVGRGKVNTVCWG